MVPSVLLGAVGGLNLQHYITSLQWKSILLYDEHILVGHLTLGLLALTRLLCENTRRSGCWRALLHIAHMAFV